ncbi:hypothetical protein BJX64DRAFT_269396 [Aspergillus heterothallicus]
MVSSSQYSLYVFVVLVGCVAFLFIAIGIYQMHHPADAGNAYADIPQEQRGYMRTVRQRNFNKLAVVARRPDMFIPVY